MALTSMRFDRRRWSPTRDLLGVVHHGTRLTKKEAEYMFRLADAVRMLVPCSVCKAEEGRWCVRRRDGQPMSNHSYRVSQARLAFSLRILPRLGRLHKVLCSSTASSVSITIGDLEPALDVDCMSCLVAASRQGG